MAGIPPHYGNGNRAFLQAFMCRGTLTFEEARPMLAAIFSANEGAEVSAEQVTREDFDSYVDAASQVISHYDYEIRTLPHQVTKARTYALVNTTSDPMTQLGTTYSAEELAFVKRLLEAMFDKHNTPRMEVMAVNEMDATKLARPARQTQNSDGHGEDGTQQQQTQSWTDRGLKHSEVELMLGKLRDEDWLERSGEGFYRLSPRALMELRTWLVDSFNDADAAPGDWQRIKFCAACKDIVTHGKRCAERDCTLRLHDFCEDAYWRMQRGKQCPQCSAEWKGNHYVGERAVTSTEAYNKGRRRSGPSGAGGKSTQAERRTRHQNEDGEEDDGGEEEEEA